MDYLERLDDRIKQIAGKVRLCDEGVVRFEKEAQDLRMKAISLRGAMAGMIEAKKHFVQMSSEAVE